MKNDSNKEVSKAKQLDQYYTNPDVAKECYDFACSKIDINKYKLLELSAGEGSFSDLFHDNFIAIDVDPKRDYIEKMDFHNFTIETTNNIAVGNPPYGHNAKLAIEFFNTCATYCEYICLILPRSFRKDSIRNKLDMRFEVIDEYPVPNKSFTLDGKVVGIPCVFQIWGKIDGPARKPARSKRTTTHLFDFCKKEDAHFALRRVGGLAGKVIESDIGSYSPQSNYFIKVNENIDQVIRVLKDLYPTMNKMAKDSGVKPCLSKPELIAHIEQAMSIAEKPDSIESSQSSSANDSEVYRESA